MVDINQPQNPYTLIFFFFFERRPQADLRPTAIRWFDLAGIAKDGINKIAVVFSLITSLAQTKEKYWER